MKKYLIILNWTNDGYCVYIPDLDIGTQGKDIEDSIFMAKDAIKLLASCEKDSGRSIPEPIHTEWIKENEKDIITFVEVEI